MAFLRLILLSTFLFAIQTYAFPSGANKKACTISMLPKHHHNTPQPSSTSPITKFDTKWNSDGETISGKKKAPKQTNLNRHVFFVF
jgi:hypothetical protein